MSHPLALGCAVMGAATGSAAVIFGDLQGKRNETCCKVAIAASLALGYLAQAFCETPQEGAGALGIVVFGAAFGKVVWDTVRMSIRESQ
jgi:hypothetical protein